MINAVDSNSAEQAAQSSQSQTADPALFASELGSAMSTRSGVDAILEKLAAAFPDITITKNAVSGFAGTAEYVAQTAKNTSITISPEMMAALDESEEMFQKTRELISSLMAAGEEETVAGTKGPATHRNVSIQNSEIRYVEVERGANGAQMRVTSLSIEAQQTNTLLDQLFSARNSSSGQTNRNSGRNGNNGFGDLLSLSNQWRLESFVSAEALTQMQNGAASDTGFTTFASSFTAQIDVVIQQVGVISGGISGGVDFFTMMQIMGLSDPIVLDLGDEGINLTSIEDGVYFDIRGDGTQAKTAFIQGNNAFLYLDQNGNGVVDDANELFGDQGGYANGFAKLARYDDNNDGVIDENDAIYGELRLWRDLNGDGVNQAEESLTLAQAGIKSLSLNHDGSLTFDGKGNAITDRSTFTRFDGSTGLMADVWLKNRV